VLARRDERRPFPDRGYGGRGHEHGAHTLLPGGEPLTEEGERTLNVQRPTLNAQVGKREKTLNVQLSTFKWGTFNFQRFKWEELRTTAKPYVFFTFLLER